MEVVTMYKVGKYLFGSKELAESVEDIINSYPDIEFSVENTIDSGKELLRFYLKPCHLEDMAFIDIDTNDVTVTLISSNFELSKQYFEYLDSISIEHSEYKYGHTFRYIKPVSLKEKFSNLLKFARKEYWGA